MKQRRTKWSCDTDGLIYDSKGKLVASAFAYRDQVTPEVLSVASEIVKSVNCHKALLEACKRAYEYAKEQDYPALYERLEQVITKAEEL